MIKWLCVFILALVSPLCDQGKPSETLVKTLDYFCIPHTSWEEIVSETQKKWLRQSGEELWNVTPRQDPSPEKSYELFTTLGLTETLHATKKNYDYVVILGVTLPEMRKRIGFLKKENICFNQLVFLVGDRPLDPEKEAGYGANETEMAKKVFQEMAPAEWNNVVFVDTPRKPVEKRPTTADTFEYWLQMKPKPGSVLVISGQPFIQRQDLIAKEYMPSSFSVETIGNGFSLEEYRRYPRGLPTVLDELARLIYQTRKCENF
jgi:hypothetical protein